MHLLALVDSPDHVCCRYRISAFQSKWGQSGHVLEARSVPRGVLSRCRLFSAELRRADAVIVQRKLFPRWQLAMLRKHARRLIFDFDDAVFLRDSYAPKGIQDARRLRRFRATVQACDLIVAGNSFLARHARRHAHAVPIVIIPTCVSPAEYPVARHDRPPGDGELAWIGSSSTLQGLERAALLLDSVAKTCPNARLKLICDRTLSLPTLPVDHAPWSERTEASELAGADLGISWIPDDDWSRGKCGLKVLQYFAAGLPVVANPVGVQKEMVRHGETGFIAETPEQWQKAIRKLLLNPELRRQMGAMARRVVEARYSVDAGAAKWLSVLDGMRNGQRVA